MLQLHHAGGTAGNNYASPRISYILHFPPQDAIFTLEESLELLSVSGIIADGEPHLHGVVSQADKQTYGGHIEPGCEVAYLAEIVIQKYPELSLVRRFDKERKIKLLEVKS